MTRTPVILSVIVNFRTPDLALKAAEATVDAMAGLAGQIVLVDNDSQDGSFEVLGRTVAAKGWGASGRVRVCASGRNGGFGWGINHAIRAGLSGGGRPDYVYIVNPDAQPETDAIRVLAEFLDAQPEVGVAGSLILHPDGTPACGAFAFPGIVQEFETAARTAMVTRLMGRGGPKPLTPGVATEVDWVSGASAMFRMSMLDQIGLFDEGFFLYFEETDLCLRARRAGHRVWYLPASRVAHVGAASTGMGRWKRTPGYWFDSRFYYFRKNHGTGYAVAATLARLAGECAWKVRRVFDRGAQREGATDCFATDLIRHSFGTLFRSRPPVGPANR